MKLYHASTVPVTRPETFRKYTNMTQESILTSRALKCANIIRAMCELSALSIQEATDIFYSSDTAGLIEEGIADLQCRSDKYLASIILEEQQERQQSKQ